MHLRRALLLFAIVLALAAVTASLSRPLERRTTTSARKPPPPPPPARERATPPARLAFATDGPKRRRKLEAGRAAVVVVETDQAGQVELAGLGLSAPADPLTAARFDVLPTRPARVTVRFTPAGTIASQAVGTLVISERGSARSGAPRARTTGSDPGTTAARGSAAGRCRCSS